MSDSLRILILEDDDAYAELVSEYLVVSGSFVLDHAPTIQALWQQITKYHYDLILIDYQLPDGTGLDALQEIRSLGYDTPVVMITGQGDERLAVQAIQSGVADYLIKGSDDLIKLPTLIQKTINEYKLNQSILESRKQVRFQALLLNNVRDAMVVWNITGTITYWNPAAEVLLERPAKDCVGLNVRDFYLTAFQPAVRIPAPEATGGMEIERQYRRKDGQITWISSRVSALRDYGDGGRLIGYMDVLRDITKRKQMEAQVLASQTRLAHATRLAAIGGLASGIAHHINNPLTTIIAEAQILQQKPGDEDICQESAEAIEKAGWRVQQTVQKLSNFAQPATQTYELLDLNTTINDALTLVGNHFLSNDTVLEVDLAKGLPRMRGNARQLSALWVNLLMLAREATANELSHRVGIRSGSDGYSLLFVEVSDDGPAIPPDEMETIFEPTYSHAPGGRGTGFELPLCQEIVRQHNGQITARSIPGETTTFKISFPVEG